MATKLDKQLTRETTIQYQNRKVLVVLSPATPADVEKAIPPLPERIELRLKGTRQKLVVPMRDLFAYALRTSRK